MENLDKFSDICPYTDEEAAAALSQLASNPFITKISQYFYPEKAAGYLSYHLKRIKSVDELQKKVVSTMVERILAKSANQFTYDGQENLPTDRRYIMMSNHRDIILDPAITQLVLFKCNQPTSHICVGSNIITNKMIESLVRSNRMIKVVRGISARELYNSSMLLSEYIRMTITEDHGSIWIAQRQGRTKNGTDLTEQGLLKMLDMSGKGDFAENFEELNIVPLSISYQYEPCDIQKAREIYISRRQKYVKQPNEDTMSIITGVTQQKGNIHLHIGTPVSRKEIEAAATEDKNDRYRELRHAINKRVIAGYHLWDNNYIAYDMLHEGEEFAHMYTDEQKENFIEYMNMQLSCVESDIDRAEIQDIFLHIYANPVTSKKRMDAGEFLENE